VKRGAGTQVLALWRNRSILRVWWPSTVGTVSAGRRTAEHHDSPLAHRLTTALQPYLGAATSACVESLAASLGKSADSLDAEDLPVIEDRLRASLSAVAAVGTVDTIVEDLRSGS
jgi:hypothetical protein